MIRTVSPLEYLKVPRPQLSWLVEGLIPRPAYLLLMGEPKAGKSFLAWNIASAIAQGHPLMGYHTPGPQKVLYLQLDTKEAAWTERLRKFDEAGVALNIPNLRLVHQDDMTLPLLVTSEAGRKWTTELVTQEDPALVILDVLREVHDDDENDSTAMKKVFDAMEPIFAERSVLILHHTRKLTQEDRTAPKPASLSRGSGYIVGRVDGYWLLYGDAPLRKLIFESRFMEQTTSTARQHSDTGLFTFPDLDKDVTLGPKLAALCANDPGKSHREIWEVANKSFGISRATYFRIMSQVACVHRTPPVPLQVGPLLHVSLTTDSESPSLPASVPLSSSTGDSSEPTMPGDAVVCMRDTSPLPPAHTEPVPLGYRTPPSPQSLAARRVPSQ